MAAMMASTTVVTSNKRVTVNLVDRNYSQNYIAR